MSRYRWTGDKFVDGDGRVMKAPDRVCAPMVVKDVTYKSPLSGKEITSRSQRREEMKRHNVREVDPGEFTPTYNSKKRADQSRRDHNPREKPKLEEGVYHRLTKSDLPERIAKTIGGP
ncbi:MAG TPA: hypothetical protein VGE09_08495 [Pseudoxanthomonas sp.]